MNNLEKAKEFQIKVERIEERKHMFYNYKRVKDNCLKEIKELLEKTKEGCGSENISFGFCCGDNKTFCPECKETIKICEEILK